MSQKLTHSESVRLGRRRGKHWRAVSGRYSRVIAAVTRMGGADLLRRPLSEKRIALALHELLAVPEAPAVMATLSKLDGFVAFLRRHETVVLAMIATASY